MPTAATPLWQLAQPLVIPAWLNFMPRLLPVVPAPGMAPGPLATPVGAFVPEELPGTLDGATELGAVELGAVELGAAAELGAADLGAAAELGAVELGAAAELGAD